jgi:hypothetical protein
MYARLLARHTLVALAGLAIAFTALMVLGSAPAFGDQVTCGETITKDTTLDNDLIDCPGDGIVIGADRITLDLNGHTIDGVGTAGPPPYGYGILSGSSNLFDPGHSDVTIENGTIQQFGAAGIHLGGHGQETADRIRHVTVSENTNGIEVYSNGNSIEESLLVSNYGAIGVDSSDYNSIIGNVIYGNGGGIAIGGKYGAAFNRVIRNRITGNFGPGMSLDIDGGGDEVILNVISQNGGAGISMFASFYDRIEHNLVKDNGGPGISITSSEERHHAQGSVFEDNKLLHNSGEGISIGPYSLRNLLDGNMAIGNADDGLKILSPSTTVTGNRALHNAAFGIEAVPGVTDGGGNRAFGNGHPLQCLNIVCN